MDYEKGMAIPMTSEGPYQSPAQHPDPVDDQLAKELSDRCEYAAGEAARLEAQARRWRRVQGAYEKALQALSSTDSNDHQTIAYR